MNLAALGTWLLDRALEHHRRIVPFSSRASGCCRSAWCDRGDAYGMVGGNDPRTRAAGDRDGLDAPAADQLQRADGAVVVATRTARTPRAILDEIEAELRARTRRRYLQLHSLTPHRRKLLAGIGRRSTNQALQRMSTERRFPILMAYLAQAAEDVNDEIIDHFDRPLTNSYARARRELDELRLSIARSTNESRAVSSDGSRGPGHVNFERQPARRDLSPGPVRASRRRYCTAPHAPWC